MERTTDKHSPRVDEALEHDVQSLVRGHAGESRAQEQRLQEDVDRAESPLDRRAALAAAVAPARWPATRDDLVAVARDSQAPDEVLSDLGRLPHGDTE
jgi:hypothetical protein